MRAQSSHQGERKPRNIIECASVIHVCTYFPQMEIIINVLVSSILFI